MKTIIYHGDCPDGWCAAYVASKRWPGATLIPATHGAPPPGVGGRDVLVVDFSWKRPVVEAMHAAAERFYILDHHATAEVALTGLPYAKFDMSKSGAMLAWEYCFPNQPAPWYVAYVQDRDLWTRKLPQTDAVNAFLMASPQTIEMWDNIARFDGYEGTADSGQAILMHLWHYVDKVIAQAQLGKWLTTRSDGSQVIIDCAVVNAAYPNISEVLHEALTIATIGVGWFERKDGMMQFSLRSQGNVEVASIAQHYGGGGHPHAAGFQVPIDHGRRILDRILNRE